MSTRLDRVDDLVGGHGRPEDRADRRLAEVDVAAQGELVELLAVLVDAEDADVADVMMAAGVDAARDLDLQLADVVLARELGEVLGDALRHRDRARIGQRAIVQARAGDDVGDLADIGLGEAQPVERAPHRRQIVDRDMRQDQVLLVADADLALAVGVGEVGHALHLHGAGVARRRAGGLQRGGDDAVARHACGATLDLSHSAKARSSSFSPSTSATTAGRCGSGGGANWRAIASMVSAGSSSAPSLIAAYSASTSSRIFSAPISCTRILMRAL